MLPANTLAEAIDTMQLPGMGVKHAAKAILLMTAAAALLYLKAAHQLAYQTAQG